MVFQPLSGSRLAVLRLKLELNIDNHSAEGMLPALRRTLFQKDSVQIQDTVVLVVIPIYRFTTQTNKQIQKSTEGEFTRNYQKNKL